MDNIFNKIIIIIPCYFILLYLFYDRNKVKGNFFQLNYEFINHSIRVLLFLPTKYNPDKRLSLYTLRISFWLLIIILAFKYITGLIKMIF